MSTNFEIRAFHPSDIGMLYKICLKTGNDGEDATDSINDEILGHFYAAPYAILEPELCFVLTANGFPCGYILGTANSVEFAQRCESEWWPRLRERYVLPQEAETSSNAHMIRLIHQGYRAPGISTDFPAHLHIDLLPGGQGQGRGRQMIEHFCDALRERDIPGLHLGVSRGNKRAMAFYLKVGFRIIDESAEDVTFGMRL